MLRAALAALLERAAARFETELSRANLNNWAHGACAEALSKRDATPDAEAAVADRAVIARLAPFLFPDLVVDVPSLSDAPPADDQLERARVWSETVTLSAKFPSDPLPAGLGCSLAYLGRDARASSAAEERLLRHVELRHDKSLVSWTNSPDGVDRDYERLGVAILLASTARRTGDLRFLNGALRMIDWFAASHIRAGSVAPRRFHCRVLRVSMECLADLETLERE